MSEEKKVQIKISLSEAEYDGLLCMRVQEHDTAENIVRKAIVEYAKKHHPESLEQ